jgi:RNA 3'-terminal phosphate cyclase (ATP)
MLRIDGSIGEGGGQTVRTALSLAAVTRRDVEVFNIRKGRRLPGLRHDLIAILRALNAVSHGRLEGDVVGSDTLRFFPGIVQAGDFEFSIGDSVEGTGSVALLLQTLLPVLALAGASSTLVARGATHGPYSPTATYVQTVFVPTVRKLGVRAEVATPRWGWAPHGSGELRAKIEPAVAFRAGEFTTRGELMQIGGSAVVSGMGDGFAERLRNRVSRRLSEVGRQANVQAVSIPSESAGAMLFLLAVFERTIAGFTGIGAAGASAEEIADTAIAQLFAYLTSYSVLDRFVTDQFLVYAALADGVTSFSSSEWTPHSASTAALIEEFLPARVSVTGAIGQPAEVEISGAGFKR